MEPIASISCSKKAAAQDKNLVNKLLQKDKYGEASLDAVEINELSCADLVKLLENLRAEYFRFA